jgi:hypothetical protein
MSVQITGSQIKNDAIDNSKIADNAVQSAQIQDNSVIAAKIASGSILEAKLGASSVTTAKIANTSVTSAKMDLSGTFDFSSGTLQAGTPSNASDVTNKSYVDGLVGSGVYWKEPARASSTANVNISNPGTASFDGITLSSGDRLLLKDQSSQAENGVYDFNGSGSALTRSSDANSADELNGLAIFVKEGTANADQGFVQTSEIANLGSDNIVFAQFTGLGQIEAGAGLTKTANRLDVAVGNGIQITSDAVVFRAGAGLDFGGSDVDVQVDDSSIEINGSGNLQVKANGITSAMIGTNQVTGSEIAALAVSSANLADGAVSAVKLGASAVTEAKIAANAVTDAKLAANSVTASAIASAVAGDGLAGGAGDPLSVSVDNTGIEINSDSLRLKDLGVVTAKLGSNAVTTAKIINNAITADKISSAVAGSGLLGGSGSALSVNCGQGLDFNGDAVDVQLGAGLEFQSGAIDVEVDDTTIEIDEGNGEVKVKDLGISSGKLANSAVSTAKIADDAVTAAKVGFQAYQELTTVSGGSTLNIDLARSVDSAFSNGIMAFKNGLALLNQTALGGSASNSDQFTLSVVGGVTRLSFGAALADADSILIVYMA